ncbi:Kae1-associated serine/threonine protein kinase [Candidatus Pacearchaeota archaeon]|nr:Kae1-associated serine/threonine protein kinase [Candidatus Pacearchaeota archaeon]
MPPFSASRRERERNQRVLSQGAEAKIILSGNSIIKDRIKKSYRIPELDEKIRKLRTRSETKLLTKASEIINCPKPQELKEFDKIKMPFIDGKKLSEHLDNFPLKQQKQICNQLGEAIAKLHDNNIIHGDLTTSNMILKNEEVYFIDFGLGFISHKYEDKAVDLHLLKQALEAKHFQNYKELLKEVFKAYKKSKDSKIVFERLKAVEKRGRYKH